MNMILPRSLHAPQQDVVGYWLRLCLCFFVGLDYRTWSVHIPAVSTAATKWYDPVTGYLLLSSLYLHSSVSFLAL